MEIIIEKSCAASIPPSFWSCLRRCAATRGCARYPGSSSTSSGATAPRSREPIAPLRLEDEPELLDERARGTRRAAVGLPVHVIGADDVELELAAELAGRRAAQDRERAAGGHDRDRALAVVVRAELVHAAVRRAE